MSTTRLSIIGTEAQAAQFRDNCLRTEALFSQTLMKRFNIPLTDENIELVAGWFKSTRDMAVGNWVASGIRASCSEHPLPRIVCLCGSTRFAEEFRKVNLDETLEGRIVLSIGCDAKSDDDLVAVGELTPEVKQSLDELHKRKIDLADEIFVLNVGDYIGESTRSEILYALRMGKNIRWLEAPSVELAKSLGVIG